MPMVKNRIKNVPLVYPTVDMYGDDTKLLPFSNVWIAFIDSVIFSQQQLSWWNL